MADHMTLCEVSRTWHRSGRCERRLWEVVQTSTTSIYHGLELVRKMSAAIHKRIQGKRWAHIIRWKQMSQLWAPTRWHCHLPMIITYKTVYSMLSGENWKYSQSWYRALNFGSNLRTWYAALWDKFVELVVSQGRNTDRFLKQCHQVFHPS